MRLGVLILQASMETLLALFNHFPLFALMLRVKDPWRLPGKPELLRVPSRDCLPREDTGGMFFLRIQVPESRHSLMIIEVRWNVLLFDDLMYSPAEPTCGTVIYFLSI